MLYDMVWCSVMMTEGGSMHTEPCTFGFTITIPACLPPRVHTVPHQFVEP
jgi:hypothetical protein